jgi:hypothetical protein
VGQTITRILLFALVAGASPVAMVSALAVLTSRRGRANGVSFLAGFMLGQTAAFTAAFLVGSAATTQREVDEHVAAALELAFGLALLIVAWPQRGRGPGAPGAGSRTRALLGRLRGLRPGTAFAVGTLLGVGGVKRLTITIVAGATVGVASLLLVEELVLGALYVLVGGVLVWVPVCAYLLAGERADGWMRRAERWLTENERRLAFFSTLVLGFLFTTDALVRLL